MTSLAFLLIGLGAAVGAWLRWLLGVVLNPLLATVPLGTLAANLIGALLMGVALGVFGAYPALSDNIKLMLTTGFLGGLTTFSTFSAETTTLLLNGQLGAGLTLVVLHVAGSLVLTAAGVLLTRAVL